MTFLGVVEVIGALVLLLVIALTVLAARRRWLARQGGTFECSIRLGSATPGAGWAIGVGRYNGDVLEWFRFYSYSARPRVTLARSQTRVVESRRPNAVEAVSLFVGQRVVRLESQGDPADGQEWELAMSEDSLTGLMSWLESAPPGAGAAR